MEAAGKRPLMADGLIQDAMCEAVKAEPAAVDPMEGWLKKKCHHIGVWKYRFFKFDGKVLRYWKRKYQADSQQPPRGEFTLTRCHAFPAPCQRFVLRAPSRAFDEELCAQSDEERDAWVRLLNSAALQYRLSVASYQVSTQRFLRARGLWEPLECAAAAAAGVPAAGPAAPAPGRQASEALVTAMSVGAMASVASTCCDEGEETVLKHVCFGSVLLQLSDKPLAPRQGRFVEAGRRALQNMRRQLTEEVAEQGRSESWVLLASVRSLAQSAPLGPLLRAQAFYEAAEEEGSWGGSADGTPLLEALHAYEEPLEESPPFASLPLARCWVSKEEECLDGSGWSIYLENRAECESQPCAWTLILGTRAECARWRHAIDVAIWAARAREAGRLRLADEALTLFDTRNAAWRAALGRRLAEAAADAPPRRGPHPASWVSRGVAEEPAEASAALRRVLAACGEACEDAEDMLDAALSQEPLRRDICEAALEAAIDPAIACVGRCWAHLNSVLSNGDGRTLLRWLDARRRSLHRLGLVHAPLDAALAGLATELSLRQGAHLRRATLQLLVREFGEAMRARSVPSSGSQTAAGGTPPQGRRPSLDTAGGAQGPPAIECEEAHSTLPVDFFTMVFSCLPFDREQDVLALRLSSQRVAKFMVWELQQVTWEWLVATLPEVHREVKPKPAGGGGAEQPLPPRAQQWLACVAALANGAPALAAQCRELGAVPLHGGGGERPCEPSQTFAVPDGSDLGPEALPSEWGLAAEEVRFEALEAAALWAACDVASARWRRLALGASPELPPEAAGLGVGGLLKAHLDAPLRLLRGWLEPSSFGRLLPKVFHVCLAGYILRLSRGLWFQPPLVGDPTEMAFFQLSEDTLHFCRYFQALAGGASAAGASEPWEPGSVLARLHAVLSSTSSCQKWRPLVTSKTQHPLGAESPGLQKDGLRNLVAVLSEGPLPLREVMGWFGVQAPLDPFNELPPPVPWGCEFISNTPGPWQRRHSAHSLQERRPSQDSLCSKVSGKGQRKRLSMPSLSLYGKPPERLVEPAPPEPSPSARGVELAEEGGVCELCVEPAGAYGAFCGLLCHREEVPTVAGSFISASSSVAGGPGASTAAAPQRPRRRWVQLVRRAPGQVAAFQVLRRRPQSLEDASTEVLVFLPLGQLVEASPQGSAGLSLLFQASEGGDVDQAEKTDQSYRPPARYDISFDCPSHLFRWKLVLEAWTSVPIPKLMPIVALGGPSANRLLSGWEDLPQQLTQQVLEQRLGGLWADVRLNLQAGGTAAARSGRGPDREERGRW